MGATHNLGKWKKASLALLLAAAAALLLGGCNTMMALMQEEEEGESVTAIALVEVYSAGEQALLRTVDDLELMTEFGKQTSQALVDIDDDELYSGLDTDGAGWEEAYVFVQYRVSEAEGDGSLERVVDVTIYDNADVMRVRVDPEIIRDMDLPEDLLTNYYNAPEETLQFLRDLAEGRK